MLSLAVGAFAYVVDLADDNSEVDLGSPMPSGADISVPCLGKFPSTTFMYPMEQKGLSHDEFSEHSLEPLMVEFAHVPMSCKDMAPHSQPCVNHEPMSMAGPFGSTGPSYFHMRLAHSSGHIITSCDNPWNSWVELDYVKVDEVVRTNCSLPQLDNLISAVGYNHQDGSLALTVTIMHGPIDGTLTEIPWMGTTGGNVLMITDMLTPPQSPSPPQAPSPPGMPWTTGPGNLYKNNRRSIESWNYIGFNYGSLDNLCWSSERGDTMNSDVFHSNCNDKGATITMARAVYLNVEYLVGGYTRATWSGGGYSGDTNDFLFQLTPNVFHSKAGDGPHSNKDYAIYRSNGYGPTFGNPHDWYVSSNMRTGYVNLGHTYKCRIGNYGQNTCRDDFLGSYSSWSISEMEVWSEN